MAEHLTIPGALEWDTVERHSIATLRYAGGKEHDVKYVSEVAYDALKRKCESAEGGWREATRVITMQRARLDKLEQALKFYADGDHLLLADADAWDTCSGEPINFLHDEAGTASVEDGSIAKAGLQP